MPTTNREKEKKGNQMKRVIAAAAAAATAVTILTACGTPPLTSGTVIGKQDIPAHNETVWQSNYGTVCGTHWGYHMGYYGYYYSCNVDTYLGSTSYQQYVPENWELHVKNDKIIQWISVSQETYGTQAVGSHWQQVEGS
jgi:hypothetical protein